MWLRSDEIPFVKHILNTSTSLLSLLPLSSSLSYFHTPLNCVSDYDSYLTDVSLRHHLPCLSVLGYSLSIATVSYSFTGVQRQKEIIYTSDITKQGCPYRTSPGSFPGVKTLLRDRKYTSFCRDLIFYLNCLSGNVSTHSLAERKGPGVKGPGTEPRETYTTPSWGHFRLRQ